MADAVESVADVFSSLIVWGGLRLASREADRDFPFGYGKAEPLAAAVVGLMLLGAGAAVAIQAVREIRTPHLAPALFTLPVLLAVVAIKEVLHRRLLRVGREVESTAVAADAWHHRSDALTSATAGVGIAVALAGGEEWAAADDWAALAAAGVIGWNALRILRPAVADLMDRSAPPPVLERLRAAALGVPGVVMVEKLKARRAGLGLFVDIHAQAEPDLTLRAAHVLSGKVKSAIRDAVPATLGVLVHMEPWEGGPVH